MGYALYTVCLAMNGGHHVGGAKKSQSFNISIHCPNHLTLSSSTPSTYSLCISASLHLGNIVNLSRYPQWVPTTLHFPLLSIQPPSNLPHRANPNKCPSSSSRSSPPLLLVTAPNMKGAGPTWSAAQLLVAQGSAD